MAYAKHNLDSPDRIVTIREILTIAESYGYDAALSVALSADAVDVR